MNQVLLLIENVVNYSIVLFIQPTYKRLTIILSYFRLGFISQWGALAGRYAALYPSGFPWPSTTQRMPFHSSNGKKV